MAKLGTSPMDARRVASALVRYRKDFRAFAQEQLKIKGQPFHLWPCQEPLLQSVEQQLQTQGFVRSVWLKARQVGCSTLVEALVAWRTMLWPNINAVVIADVAPRSATLFDIAKSFYEHMDENIRPSGRYVTKRELVFANPSRLTGFKDPGLQSRIMIDSAAKRSVAIGARWDIAHLSECARFPDPTFVMDGVIPAVHRVPGTMLIFESSAEMSGRWFRDFCESSMRGETGFDFKFVPWYLQPEYYICPVCKHVFPDLCQDPMHELEAEKYMRLEGEERHIMVEFGLGYGHILWMRTKLAEMGNDWDLFRQSFPLTVDDAWVQSGIQAFPAKVLRELRGQICPPVRVGEVLPGPIMADIPNGRLKVWEAPKVGKAYDIGVDVSQGVGRDDAVEMLETDSPVDWSVACVLERGSNKQVAEWASRAMDPVQLATTLYWLGKYYLDAQIAVETNGIGGITNQQLAKLGYFNQYIWRYRDEVVPRYSKKTGWECVVPESKILTAELQWVAAEDLNVGTYVVGCAEYPQKVRGACRSLRMQRIITRQVFVAPLIEVVLTNGQRTRVSENHPFLVFRSSLGKTRWMKAIDLRLGDMVKYLPIWETIRTYDAGRLSAFLDGEGHLSQCGNGWQMLISQAEGPLAQEINELWSLLGFDWTFKWIRHKQHPHEKPIATSGLIRKAEILRALGSLRPTRLRRVFADRIDLSRCTVDSFQSVAVEQVERVGNGKVVGFTTDPDHTLIADGIVGHNTNSKSKPWLVGFATHELMNGRVQIRSERLLKEMETYVRKDVNEWGAVAGRHDDAVVAFMIALLVSDDENFERYFGLRKTVEGKASDGAQSPEQPRVPESYECDRDFNRKLREKIDTPWE